MNTWKVYKIICSGNGKVYIGSTMHFGRRIRRHFAEMKSGKHHSSEMVSDFANFGRSSFSVEVLKETDSVISARELEGEYICKFDAFHSGYNATLSGKHLDIPKDIRKRLWEENALPVLKSQKWREECRERANKQFSNPKARKKQSDIQKKLISEDPEKWRKACSAGGKKVAQINREKMRKPILRSDGKVYEAIMDAAKDMRPDHPEKGRACIRQALKLGNVSMGFAWKYIKK